MKDCNSRVVNGYTMYNVHEIAEFNENNKEKGIRVFLRRLEFDYIIRRRYRPATLNGRNISCSLDGYGMIETPGYSLEVVTSKGRKFEVIENGIVIHKGKMDKFNAKEIYTMLSY
jgi:hypothetical protein